MGVGESDGSGNCKVNETYRLDPSKLTKIIFNIANNTKAKIHLGHIGIGILGTYHLEKDNPSLEIGRLVNGHKIGKSEDNLYLQTLEYDNCYAKDAKPNLVDLLREFII